MKKTSKFNRLSLSLALTVSLLSGCASSTAPGTLGVDRSQLLMVASSQINSQAALGFTKMSSHARQNGKLNTDRVMTRRVRDIGNRLIREAVVFRADAASWAWEINVFDSNEVNAFCAPGGKIGVNSGIITRLDLTDDELAAIMGHEIAHALREHSREKVSQKVLSSIAIQTVAASAGKNAALTGLLAQAGTQMFLHLPNSREMELEADVMGLELMARAGYNPRHASSLWRKMQAVQGGSANSDFFSTHPSSGNRIGALDAAAEKMLPVYERRIALGLR